MTQLKLEKLFDQWFFSQMGKANSAVNRFCGDFAMVFILSRLGIPERKQFIDILAQEKLNQLEAFLARHLPEGKTELTQALQQKLIAIKKQTFLA